MALSKSQTATLRRKYIDNLLEVEHLLKIARTGDPSDAAILRALALELGWSRDVDGPVRVVPLGAWCDVVCAFLESGFPGVEEYAKRGPGHVPIWAGLLEEIKTPESVELLLRLGTGQTSLDDRYRVVRALNAICSFKNAARTADELKSKVATWLHALLDESPSENHRAAIVYALRGVGDAESVARLRNMPGFPPPWEDAEKLAIRAISKRLEPGRAPN